VHMTRTPPNPGRDTNRDREPIVEPPMLHLPPLDRVVPVVDMGAPCLSERVLEVVLRGVRGAVGARLESYVHGEHFGAEGILEAPWRGKKSQ
jgi:hypothetical protein